MNRLLVAMLLLTTCALAPVRAQDKVDSTNADATKVSAAMADGEIRRVDKDAKKITIRHGPLAQFDMPAMTMVFQVKDPAMLDQVKVGDKVRFLAERTGGAFTLTQIEPAK